jgi:PAS domain S-box-containing protein
MPVGVFIASPGGRPYYISDEGERLLGRGVVPGIGGDDLAESYGIFQAGTDRPYLTRNLPLVRALRGLRTHVDDMEIHKPDGSVTPTEVWGRPVYGAGGEIDYAIIAINDPSERLAREKIIAGQAALLELAYDAIFVRDPDGRITYWNAGAEHTYGFTRAEAVGQIAHVMLGTQFSAPLASIEAIASERGRWDGELTHRCADGQFIIVESRWEAQRGPDGSLLGFMEINRDITARKDAEREALRRAAEIQALNASLEQRVQERTVHLERANKHLTAFTYSVAHDLRTPLRGISGFAEALVEEYGDRLDETGRGYAGRIQAASGRMGTVLDDLLHLSWVSRAEMELQDTDLSAEVTAICDRLRAGDPDRHVRVTVEDGVRATADPTLIRTALEKLLENAWKFTAGREDATIEFATTEVDEAPLACYVRDNGAGFDPAYADKLFQPFQRLHAVGEFPGTGIGLASVQRIIDRHGGRVWAEGAVGHGATFYFTLDAQDTLMTTCRSRPAEDSPDGETARSWRVKKPDRSATPSFQTITMSAYVDRLGPELRHPGHPGQHRRDREPGRGHHGHARAELGQLRTPARRGVRLLPGHHAVLPAGLPDRRAARHPRPGPALPAVLGVLPPRQQLRGPERRRLRRGRLRLQPGRPLRRRTVSVPGRRRPPAVGLLGHPAHLGRRRRDALPARRHLLGLRSGRPDRHRTGRGHDPQSLPELAARPAGPAPGPDRPLGQLVRRRPGQRHHLADADPVPPRLHRLLPDRHARVRHPAR